MTEEKAKGKRVISEFDNKDDGSFDRLVQKTYKSVESSGGQPDEAIKLLQFYVAEAFVNRIQNHSTPNTIIHYERRPPESSQANKTKRNPNQKKKSKHGSRINPKVNSNNSRELSFEELGLEPPKISTYIERKIAEKGGTDIKLVIMKRIFATDLSNHHDRLSVPKRQIRDPSFLTDEEKTVVEKTGLRVMVMEPCGEETSMIFVKWYLEKSDTYALRTSWKDFLRRNHGEKKLFKLKDIIHLWSFRIDRQLWFAIDKVYDKPIHGPELPPLSSSSNSC